MAGAGMDDEPGRLAHHDQVVVGEPDVDGDRLGTGRSVGRRFGQQLDERAGLEAVTLGDGLPAHEDRAVVDEASDLGAAPAGEKCEGPVQPLARQRAGHGELAHTTRLIAGRGVRRGRANPIPAGARLRS
jgi:hypothetical protein